MTAAWGRPIYPWGSVESPGERAQNRSPRALPQPPTGDARLPTTPTTGATFGAPFGMDKPRPSGEPASETPPAPERLRELREHAQAVLAQQRGHAAGLGDAVEQHLQRIADEVGAAVAEERERLGAEHDTLVAQASETLADDRSAFEAERGEWEQLRDRIEANLEKLRAGLQSQAEGQASRGAELAEQEELLAEERRELGAWAAELAEEREKLEHRHRELHAQQEQLAATQADPATADAELAERARQLESQAATAELERGRLKADLEAEQARVEKAAEAARKYEADRKTWAAQRGELEAELAELVEAAGEAGQRLAQAADLQDKFDLAVQDVQQHRRRVEELEQELAARPAAGGDESAELARLRAQRDDLRDRLAAAEQLASAAAAPAEPPSQEVEDLRRRFELAVEDVRQLKTENAG
ncbi:MAG: hypothetical protein AAF790_06540, partial [Planctomycetota bacterium]